MSKILVTGGAGFIGSHLVKRLVDDNHEVVVIDNLLRGNKIETDVLKKILFHEGDVRDADLIDKLVKDCDYVFHFAAVLGVDIVAEQPVETMEVEIIGTYNIVQSALKHKVKKVLYASTSGIYSHTFSDKLFDEEMLVDPRTSYAQAKRYNEIYLRSQFEENGLESVSLRFFNIYGTRQDNRMVVPRFFEQALSNEDITVFDDGNQTRDFTYIDDAVEACIRLMEKSKKWEIVNIANEKEWRIIELAEVIKNLTNTQSKVIFVEAPGKRRSYEVKRRVGSSAKLSEIANFQPKTKLEDGLKVILENLS